MTEQRTCGCEPGCTIPYGTCHCGCGAKTTIARQNHTKQRLTRGEPTWYIRGHAGRKAVHELTGIDEQARIATCSVCGPVSVKPNGEKVTGGIQWRCLRRVSTEHYLTDIDEITRTAFCRGCGRVVQINSNTARGKGWVCAVKQCADAAKHRRANPEAVLAGHKAWRDANPDRIRDYQLQRLYGITVEEYRAEVARRSGRCDICGEVPHGNGPNGLALCVEHDHVTNAIRGYADRDCNTMIGAAGEDPVRLAQGIIYLKPSRDQLTAIIQMLEEAGGVQQAPGR
jgi:hypothetical protein